MVTDVLRKRNSSVELLRIISMFLIVLSHYAVHNGIDIYGLPFGFNRFLLEFANWGNISVIIFVLITGFFSINNRSSFKLKKVLSMVLQVFFYSSVIYLIFVLAGVEKFSFIGLIKNFLPITFRKYWFMAAYIILYFFIPYINRLLHSLDRKEHFRLIVLLLVLFSILPMITTQHFYGNELAQFVMFYIVGAYLGKYRNNFFGNKKHCWMVLVGGCVTLMASIIIFDLLGFVFPLFGEHSTYFLSRQSIFSILIATSIFSLFSLKKSFSNKYINSISACVLGVYLISDNDLVRSVIWTKVFNVPNYVGEPILILHLIASVTLVFIVCAIIEYVRQKTLEKFFSKIYDYVEKKIKQKNGNLDVLSCG